MLDQTMAHKAVAAVASLLLALAGFQQVLTVPPAHALATPAHTALLA